MGVDHGAQVPQNLEWGTLMQIVVLSSDFVVFENFKHPIAQSIRICIQKGAFYGIQNTPKMPFWSGLCPVPHWGAHDTPQIPWSAGEGTLLPIPYLRRLLQVSPQNSS